MRKRILKLTLAAVLCSAIGTTTSASSNPLIQSSSRSKQVSVKIHQDGDTVVKTTKEVTTENGIKTTKITQECTKDGQKSITTQTNTEKVKGRKCEGCKKSKKWCKQYNQCEKHGDCLEKCSDYCGDHDNIVVGDDATPEKREYNERAAKRERYALKRMQRLGAQPARQAESVLKAVNQMMDHAINGTALAQHQSRLNQEELEKQAEIYNQKEVDMIRQARIAMLGQLWAQMTSPMMLAMMG